MKGDLLGEYWQRKYQTLQAQPSQSLVRSLRSQLVTIKRLAQDKPEETERKTLDSIAAHARIALELEPLMERGADDAEDDGLFG